MSSSLENGYQIDPACLPDESILFGHSSRMLAIRERLIAIAATDLPVLIQGESGTGKELFAEFLHLQSNRSEGPFIRLNCALTSAVAFESEIFGWESDDLCAARECRYGAVRVAECGTVFLDEIGELSWALQEKLLRLLERGCYQSVGSLRGKKTNARFIFTSSIDLKTAVEKRRFRPDLLGRLRAAQIHVLPLRERKEDIPLLCEYLMERLAKKFGMKAEPLSLKALNTLRSWHWPGNIRELENAMGRILLLGVEDALGFGMRAGASAGYGEDGVRAGESGSGNSASIGTCSRRCEVDRESILNALLSNGWNRRKAAQQLKMSHALLLQRMRCEGLSGRRRSHGSP